MKEVNLYTMTAFKGLKRQSAKASYILEMKIDGKTPATLQKTLILQSATANEGEIKIICEALARMRESCHISIYTESVYVAAGYNQGWITSWKENHWKTSRGKDVANKEEWIKLDSLLGVHEFNFKVGHDHEYRRWLMKEVER